MNVNYDAIIFDLGGVILNINYQLTINAFKSLGISNFETRYTQSQQNKIFDDLEIGKISDLEFYGEIRRISKKNLTNFQIKRAWNAMLLDIPQHRIDLLKQLKTKCPVFLLSNTNAIHLTAFQQIIKKKYQNSELLENIFNQTYYSHLIGKRKPNREAFELILNEHNLKANRTLFIDDSIQHIKGANAVGFQTIHLVDKDIGSLF